MHDDGAAAIERWFHGSTAGRIFGISTWPEMIALAAEADCNPRFDSIWVGDSVMAKPRPESIALLGDL